MNDADVHLQITALSGRNAASTATLGLLILGMGCVVAWLVRTEPWPIVAASALVFLPVVALGLFVAGLAAWFHARKAVWRLRADEEGVSLTMETATGRRLKHEFAKADALMELVWIEGDADIAGGVRLGLRDGTNLFVPADSFDTASFWVFASERYGGSITIERKRT